MPAHTVPSALKHGGGGGGWEPATGAAAIATAAAPANNRGVIFVSFAFMSFGYHDRKALKPSGT
jgi:hypothetical protein